ncbi:MAG: hypothetical protein LBK28_07055, partial [Propionibacteriaceae bacterium]|jgi:hypothetical protein|nr:hypothetical protein [Propionibacteriaceae bacterium]
VGGTQVGDNVAVAGRNAEVLARLPRDTGFVEPLNGVFANLNRYTVLVDDFAQVRGHLSDDALFAVLSGTVLLGDGQLSEFIGTIAGAELQPIPRALDSSPSRYSSKVQGNVLFVVIFGLGLLGAAFGTFAALNALIVARRADFIVHRVLGAGRGVIGLRLAVFAGAAWLLPALLMGWLASSIIGQGQFTLSVMAVIGVCGLGVTSVMCAWASSKIMRLDESQETREGTW